ncbi:hypothetical protein [Halosimplex pelagicum]|uniref:Uncharacterized protein n=1 Tax=Halosimplex pelagicum TaxID=869886 RepID=A0A7D5TUV2_9EURY|nr:hypothetical protein [Halosimplex pelagicum]QLH82694.1 hypothetical protein HZS54_14155 [Halosimplex pelagicum]
MVPEIVDYALVVAYLLLVGVLAVRYRRGEIAGRKLPIYLGMCLTWLAYGLLQVAGDGPVPTGTTLNDGLDALAVVLLVAGIYLLYRGWRHGGDGTESSAASG